MRVLIQRVTRARVLVKNQLRGEIAHGLVLLIGIHPDDDENALRFCAEKCAHLRIFADEAGKMNRSVLDVGGSVLAVSQFTLYGDCRRGRRPSFDKAAPPEQAAILCERFVDLLQEQGLEVAQGVFGAHMMVEINNDGPVTLVVENP
tara:strand:- start:23 stop:463 length:441 start_codon:yes stop_codon:yes gene_type:complete